MEAGGLDRAEGLCRRILEAHADQAQALHLLGLIAHRRGRAEDALGLLRRSIELAPEVADFHSNLGTVLAGGSRMDEATACFRRATELDPRHASAWSNLGTALERSGLLEDAVAAHRRAIELCPDNTDALRNLAVCLEKLARPEEAVDVYRRAIRLRPDATTHSGLLYCLHYLPQTTPEMIFEESVAWARLHAPPLPPPAAIHEPDVHRRLRVGYLSHAFRRSPQCVFAEPVLRYHDTDSYAVYLYGDVTRPDAVTERVRGFGHTWRDIVGLGNQQVAELVRRDRIDILVDLAGHTPSTRLGVFAARAAPLQVAWIAYPSTTGLHAIDYRITDSVVDPPGSERYYTEELVRLDQPFLCYRPAEEAPEVGPLPADHAGYITFGCLNRPNKINPLLVEVWSRVLQTVPASRLLLLSHAQGPAPIQAMFARHGVTSSQLEFLPRTGHRAYMEAFNRVDLHLDPYPYNGHTTTCDGLWMGVPIVSWAGQTAVSRLGLCLLGAIGLGDLVAQDAQQYIAKAVTLAQDRCRLRMLRGQLRQRMVSSVLCDAPRFTRALEGAYRALWARRCAQACG